MTVSLVIFILKFFLFFVGFFRPTFQRIVRNGSTEQFSGLPYIYALLNCWICLWYGTPLISSNNILVMTVNAMGSVFQLAYIILFIIYADKRKKVYYLLFAVWDSNRYGRWSPIFQ